MEDIVANYLVVFTYIGLGLGVGIRAGKKVYHDFSLSPESDRELFGFVCGVFSAIFWPSVLVYWWTDHWIPKGKL